jgi:hypothetical protein
MSIQKREALVKNILDRQSSLGVLVKDMPPNSSVMAGSWDLVSFSFQQGFEAMWDLAQADHPDHSSPFLEMPLLSLWRQSIELTLKSCILEIDGIWDKQDGHKIQKLFEQFKALSTSGGLNNDDDLTRNVQEMIAFTHSFDPHADRFRYPTNKQGDAYNGINIDLEKLFQAHWTIVTYCEGTVVELREQFGIGLP